MNDPFKPGLLELFPHPPRKVVLLRASRIGDFICATPALRALRAAVPQAEITMITLPMLQDLVWRSPYIDRYAPFPGFPGIAQQFFEARQTIEFFQQMQEEKFELAIQMQGTGVYSNPFTLLLGAKITAGFVRPGDSAGLMDKALPMPEEGHEVDRILALLQFLGIQPIGKYTEFPLWQEDHTAAERLLEKAQPPLIGLHPAARDLTRRWGLERFAEAGVELYHRYGGTLVVIGEAEERRTAEILLNSTHIPALNLTGRTPLGVLGAVITRLAVLLTNDTGPAHIAYALGTPTVTVFGGGDLQRYGALEPGPFRTLSYPVPCRPCTYSTCPIGYVCLERIKVDQVVEAAGQVICLT